MRIRLVAIHALRENQWFLEIAAAVALDTVHARMFSQQRILGSGMIELLVHRFDRNLLPATGVVARLAVLLKASVVDIVVAVRAFVERYTHVPWLTIRTSGVALLACDLCVQPG